MKKISIAVISIMLINIPVFAEISVKIRDITKIDGLKENQVYGYGLVVGLPGTGDSRSGLARISLENFLKNLGMEPETFKSKNVAAVLLTANLPAFVRVGDRIDITVSSIGDAKSLEGGILIQSPLRGADGNVYVAAQGTLEASGSNGKNRGVKTVARISGGGVVERNLVPEVVVDNTMFLVLAQWDFGVADRIIKAVRKKYPASKPEITQDGKIKLALIPQVPLHEFVANIQNIEITPGDRARVVINEKDGTIVGPEETSGYPRPW